MSKHLGSIASDMFGDDAFNAECLTCKWKGPVRKTEKEALKDLDEHYKTPAKERPDARSGND